MNVNYWPKADISYCSAHVCFRGQSGHDLVRCICLLLTQSGHSSYLRQTFICAV